MKTPVLFCIFNRLDTVEKTLLPVRDAKPEKLYIAADGPRLDKEGEHELTDRVREYVLDNIDWVCEVKTLFHEKNLGCDEAMSTALKWFFSYEEEGIIIEDDIITSPQFFNFCELMLKTYRYNPNVLYISGFNPLSNMLKTDYTFLSFKPATWGWATWRRFLYPDNKEHYRYHSDAYYQKLCNKKQIINAITARKDLQKLVLNDLFAESRWENNYPLYKIINYPNSCMVIPNKNLTSHIGNVGFHFNGENFGDIEIEEFDISRITLLKEVAPDLNYQDQIIENLYYGILGGLFKQYGKEKIDKSAVITDYRKIKAEVIISYLRWFYFRYIKFRKKRAKAELEYHNHHKYLLSRIEPFYIYVTKYYNQSCKISSKAVSSV